MNLFERIINALQFEISRPSSYGVFHIGCILISFLILLYLIKRKEKNHEKSLKKILIIYGFGSLILEVLKQIIWSFNYENGVVTWDYQWYAFPFQLCTTPIFISIICVFLNKTKLRDKLLSYMAFFTILGGIATAFYPETCFVRTLLVDIHTMYLHFGSLIVSIYLLNKEININFKSLINGYKIFIVFVVIAQILNITIYKSGILLDETFNMFYISPYFESSLPIYNIIQANTPYLVFLLFYLVTIFIGGLIVFGISKIFNKKSI